MRDAQSLLDQVISYAGENIRDEDIAEVLGLIDWQVLNDTIEAIASKNIERCMEIVENIYHFGYDLQYFCRELLQYLRNLILIKVSQRPKGLIELSGEELEIYKNQAEKFQFDQLNHLFSLLLKGEQEIAQSTFPRTMLEMTLIRMATLQPILPIDEMIKKLEALGDKELSKGWGERRTSSTLGKVVSSVDSGKNNEEGEPLSKNSEEIGKRKIYEKNEDLKNFQKEDAFGEPSPKILEEKWRGLIDFTRAKNPILGSFLALGSLVHLTDEKIEIGFDENSFHHERMLEKENRSQLESVCHEYLKRKTKVVISSLKQEIGSKGRVVLGRGEGARNGQERRSEKGEEGNPLIQEALSLFNGKIVEG